MRKFRLCIFDWNGTLQDDVHHIYECGTRRIFAHFGLPCPTLDEYRHEVRADFMESFYWPHGVPKDVTAQDLNAIMIAGFKEKAVTAALFADAPAVVAELRRRGYELVIVSGYPSVELMAAAARNGLYGYFSRLIGDVRDKPAAFSNLMDEFNVEGGDTAAVGDTVEDALAAGRVGATPYICPRGFHPFERIEAMRDRVPSLVIIGSLADLLPHFP